MIARLTVRWERLVGALALIALCTGASAQTITVTPSSLPDGEAGVAYNQTLTATEVPISLTCCTWSATGLPASLPLTFGSPPASTAQIMGTPVDADAGPLSFTVTATDT